MKKMSYFNLLQSLIPKSRFPLVKQRLSTSIGDQTITYCKLFKAYLPKPTSINS